VADAELVTERVCVVIDNAKERVILLAEWFEIGEPAVISVVLDCECPSLG